MSHKTRQSKYANRMTKHRRILNDMTNAQLREYSKRVQMEMSNLAIFEKSRKGRTGNTGAVLNIFRSRVANRRDIPNSRIDNRPVNASNFELNIHKADRKKYGPMPTRKNHRSTRKGPRPTPRHPRPTQKMPRQTFNGPNVSL